MPDIVAEIDDTIALGKPRSYAIVQSSQSRGFAMNGGNRPDPPDAAQSGKSLIAVSVNPVHDPRSRAVIRPALAVDQADNSCSMRWVAVDSSIRSTAAYSRTKRSRAA
jgi:hypothetical protein